MYFASSIIILLLLPLTLVATAGAEPTSKLRKLNGDPTISFQGSIESKSGIKTRQDDSCATLEVTYQRCLNTLSSTGADSCVDCVNDIWPDGDQVACTDFHDFACAGPSTCSSCGDCQDEISEWFVCIHDNGGCTPQDCSASSSGGGLPRWWL